VFGFASKRFTIGLFTIKVFTIKFCTSKLFGNTKAESGEFVIKTKAESNCQKRDMMEFDSIEKAGKKLVDVRNTEAKKRTRQEKEEQ
jgi:hypothetical protein